MDKKHNFWRKLFSRKTLSKFFGMYAIFLTFIPLVNPGSTHWRYVLFSLLVCGTTAVVAVFGGMEKEKGEAAAPESGVRENTKG